MPEVLEQVADDFGVSWRQMKARKGKQSPQWRLAREARDELCRRLTIIGYSATEIGYFLNKRSRTAIEEAVRRAQRRIRDAPKIVNS